MTLPRAVALCAYAMPWVGKAKGVRSSCPASSQLTSSHNRQYKPHCEPNAHLMVFAAILATPAKQELLEEPPGHIHDCKSGCNADKRKREFL